ncbi:MAG: hypothetical protein NT027_07465 [Proteobacteria bacterium]|nr:hypothetical protein [Pseudomonadota bacterium]
MLLLVEWFVGNGIADGFLKANIRWYNVDIVVLTIGISISSGRSVDIDFNS